eukprot:scpid16025/ scgid22570/ 
MSRTCNACGVRVCEKTSTASAHSSKSEARSVRVMEAAQHGTARAHRIRVQLGSIFHKEDYGTCLATTDTGADACIMGHSLLEFLTIHPNQVRPVQATQIIAANGSDLTCIGTLSLAIRYGDRVAPCTVFVCSNHDGMLLSWEVCRQLQIIPEDYPNPIQIAQVETPNICATDSDTQVQQLTDISSLGRRIPDTPSESDRARIRSQLIAHFSSVFTSEDTLQTMAGPPMRIHVQEDAIPTCVHGTRPVSYTH